jgi:hypothetical protein
MVFEVDSRHSNGWFRTGIYTAGGSAIVYIWQLSHWLAGTVPCNPRIILPTYRLGGRSSSIGVLFFHK